MKYDNCYVNPFVNNAQEQYETMGRALERTGRNIFYSICSWGQDEPWFWAPYVGDSWRISGDIGDLFRINTWGEWYNCPCTSNWCPKVVVSGGHDCSVLNILGKIEHLTQYTSSLGFNDADMLEVGRGGMTNQEYRTHFAFWAALKSPLLIGADLATLSPENMALLKNKELLAVNQDPLRESISLYSKEEKKSQIWRGNLADGSFIVLVLNEQDTPQKISISFTSLGFHRLKTLEKGEYFVRDLFSFKEFYQRDNATHTIDAHDTLVFRVMADEGKHRSPSTSKL